MDRIDGFEKIVRAISIVVRFLVILKTVRIIPSLALLMKSDEVIDRSFVARLISLVCNGSRGINLIIANSGAVARLITLMDCIE